MILLLQKGAYPYEYMIDWEKLNKTSLPKKEGFYSHLNMEPINVFQIFCNMCLEICEPDFARSLTAS